MTEQLPEEVYIVGYRYRDNADDVSKLFKLNRPIEKKDIIEVFGDDITGNQSRCDRKREAPD